LGIHTKLGKEFSCVIGTEVSFSKLLRGLAKRFNVLVHDFVLDCAGKRGCGGLCLQNGYAHGKS
jgi:hypothetical protein